MLDFCSQGGCAELIMSGVTAEAALTPLSRCCVSCIMRRAQQLGGHILQLCAQRRGSSTEPFCCVDSRMTVPVPKAVLPLGSTSTECLLLSWLCDPGLAGVAYIMIEQRCSQDIAPPRCAFASGRTGSSCPYSSIRVSLVCRRASDVLAARSFDSDIVRTSRLDRVRCSPRIFDPPCSCLSMTYPDPSPPLTFCTFRYSFSNSAWMLKSNCLSRFSRCCSMSRMTPACIACINLSAAVYSDGDTREIMRTAFSTF